MRNRIFNAVLTLCGVMMAVTLISCASFEKNAYISLGGTTTAVEIARQAYINYANNCLCVTSNQFRRVQNAYESYQTAAALTQQAIVNFKSAATPNENALKAALDGSAAETSNLLAVITSALPTNETARLNRTLAKVNH